MFTFTSREVVKSVGYRRFSHLVCGNFVRKCSPLTAERKISSKSQLSTYNIKNCQLALRCGHKLLKTSGLHRCSLGSFFSSVRYYQTKSKDCNKEEDDNSETESKAKNILDDIEFQSILKDFSRDFGVNDETSKFLEEIKQTHHSTFEDETEKSPSRTPCTDSELHYKNGSKSSTVSLSGSVHKFSGSSDCNSPEASHVEEIQEDSSDKFFHIDQELETSAEYDAKRGKEGVFDIGELVEVLREENLVNISVIQVPDVFHYTDYLVLTTAKSPRHCHAIVEFLIKLYKKKKSKDDPFIVCGGKETSTWKSLDMGNIVLHIFLEDIRNFYDIESLWLLDRKYDRVGSVQSEAQTELTQWETDFLNSLNPQ